MTRFDLHTSSAQMHDAMKDLMATWECAAEDWDDEVSRKFCERHLEPLGLPVKMALDAVGHMAQQIGQMQRECEE